MPLSAPLHPAALPPDQLLQSCQEAHARRSGPGGQHRNKVETAVILTHTPTGIAAEANEKRSQAENRKAALFRLRVRLALGVRTSAEHTVGAYPSGLWRSRLKAGKLSINPAHSDLPALLAEALDVLAAEDWNDPAAAARLMVSRTQLLRLLKLEPAALRLLNQQRESQGFRPVQ